MSARHTPFPWAVHPQRAVIVPEAHLDRPLGGALDLDFDLRHYAQEICAMHWPDPHRSEREVQANARVIAVAPEMLAMLKHMVHWHDQLSADDLARAQAVIDKAEGR